MLRDKICKASFNEMIVFPSDFYVFVPPVLLALSSYFKDSSEFYDEENENKQTESDCAITIAHFIRNTLNQLF